MTRFFADYDSIVPLSNVEMKKAPWGDMADAPWANMESAPMGGTVSYVTELGEQDETPGEWVSSGRTLDGRPIRDEIASAIDRWTKQMGVGSIAQGSLFFRNRFTLTANFFDQIAMCQDAVEYDEILGAICDSTEGLAFGRMTLECLDDDQEDVWNQWKDDVDLDSRFREQWRELFKVSQVYVGMQWSEKIYKVRTKPIPDANYDDEDIPADATVGAEDLHPSGVPKPGPKKRARRKSFALTMPTFTIIDPAKILPVGQLMFNQERFAYIADDQEDEAFKKVFSGETVDPVVTAMIEGPYTPTRQDLAELRDPRTGMVDAPNLWLIKRDAIYRHTLSRAQYERWASIRLKSILPTLEMKAHLRASDRAALIGATNFIVVLKRGSDKFPAKPGEVEQLREQARVVARMPVLVGDHRLSVEIITPKTDFVLDDKRYNLLDERIVMRGLSTFRFGGRQSGMSDTSSVTTEEIARGIESRRDEMARSFRDGVIKLIMEKNHVLTEKPEIAYHPKRVVIQYNADIVNAVMQLRDRGDISRETELEELNYDQEIEYMRRKREKAMEPVFQSSVPHSSPLTNPHTVGSTGGRPFGGGGDNGPNNAPPGAGGPKVPA